MLTVDTDQVGSACPTHETCAEGGSASELRRDHERSWDRRRRGGRNGRDRRDRLYLHRADVARAARDLGARFAPFAAAFPTTSLYTSVIGTAVKMPPPRDSRSAVATLPVTVEFVSCAVPPSA